MNIIKRSTISICFLRIIVRVILKQAVYPLYAYYVGKGDWSVLVFFFWGFLSQKKSNSKCQILESIIMRLSTVYAIITLVACACGAILKGQLYFNTVNAIDECNMKLDFSAKVFATATGHTLVQLSIDGKYNLTDGQMDEFIECVKSQGGIATMPFFSEDVHDMRMPVV